MGKVTSLTISDAGFGYTSAPSISIAAPDADSGNASLSATVTDNRISSINIDSAGRYYVNTPSVTIGLPDADSQGASATVNVFAGDSGISGLNLTNAGTYYTSAPNVTINNIVRDGFPTNWTSDSAKWGNYAYKLNSNYQDSEYTNFDGSTVTTNCSLEFWIKTPDNIRDGQFLQLPTAFGNEDDNNVAILNQNIYWNWTEGTGATAASVNTDSSPISAETYHYVQLVRVYDSPNTDCFIYVDGVKKAESQDRVNIDTFVDDKIVLNNDNLTLNGICLDAIRFNTNAAIYSTPDSDRNPYASNSDSDLNYQGFVLKDPNVTANIANGKVTGFNVVARGNFITSASATVDSATGSYSDFRATATAVVDGLDAGIITSVIITDSGGMYVNAPTVSIDSADGNAENFRAKATLTLDGDGTVSTVTITDAGSGYSTAPVVTIEKVPNLADTISVNDKVEQTLSTGVIMNGEVSKYSDSDALLHLVHVGAEDGKYHEFVTGRAIEIFARSGRFQKTILSVAEENKISQNEQNTDFSTISDDFLDFSEDNPFGDPENN